jgi:group II intron reverse transcriptase/maturase
MGMSAPVPPNLGPQNLGPMYPVPPNPAMPNAAPLTCAEMLSLPLLRASWQATLARQPRPGPDGLSVEAFAHNAEIHLMTLHAALHGGTFRPGAAWRSWVPKPGGGERAVVALGVPDRIVEGALLSALRPRVEAALHPAAFAYRQGLGALRAAQELVRRRDQGLSWVVRGDVSACFDSIPHAPLLHSLQDLLAPDALALMHSLLTRTVIDRGRHVQLTTGVPQGSLVAPLLANWYLRPFDLHVTQQGGALVRYADDFVIASATLTDTAQLLSAAHGALAALHLNLNAGKTRALSFEQGFTFLGFEFRGPAVRVAPERLDAFRTTAQALLSGPHAGQGGPGVREVNDLIRGWRGYFTIGQVQEDFRALDDWLGEAFPHLTGQLARLSPSAPPLPAALTVALGGYARPARPQRAALIRPRPVQSGGQSGGQSAVQSAATSPVVLTVQATPQRRTPADSGAWALATRRELERVRALWVAQAWQAAPHDAMRAAALLAARVADTLSVSGSSAPSGSALSLAGVDTAVGAALMRAYGPVALHVRAAALYSLCQSARQAVALAYSQQPSPPQAQQHAVADALAGVLAVALIDIRLPVFLTSPSSAAQTVKALLNTAPGGEPGNVLTWQLVLAREARTAAQAYRTGQLYVWREL